MKMSADACLSIWWPAIVSSIGRPRARLARPLMERLIDKAKDAEAEGRIADMQPTFAIVNTAETIADGYWFLEFVYHPVVDGKKGSRARWTATILTPEDNDDRAPEEETGSTEQGGYRREGSSQEGRGCFACEFAARAA